MTELEKYEAVNSSNSIEELQEAIRLIGENSSEKGSIMGRKHSFKVEQQCTGVELIVKEGARANICTRSYGIRQQALYLKYYELI